MFKRDEVAIIQRNEKAYKEWKIHYNSGLIDSISEKAKNMSKCCMKSVLFEGEGKSWTKLDQFETDKYFFRLTVKIEMIKK